ncbi:MAG: hypothetical protein HQK88_00745 [Nitrospirae bacterium]|nr:hypothetical protein [Nitrospirota bacterium]MBF0535128.1 hypothetical protein [Nitrospirota bacterium]MBF0615322.1 hypothetical protein [Nitrospirota bacterium]
MDIKNLSYWYKRYTEIIIDLAVAAGFCDDIMISEKAFTSAFLEAQKDIKILSYRRKVKKGISHGKIAGIFSFRFIRWQIVYLPAGLLGNSLALKLNYIAGLAFGLKMLGINISTVPNHLISELEYIMMRRHINQELIGICFEMMLAKN